MLLADRGYYSGRYLRALDAVGGYFIVRAKTNIGPMNREAIGSDDIETEGFRIMPLNAVRNRLHRYPHSDLGVCFGTDSDDDPFSCRLVLLAVALVPAIKGQGASIGIVRSRPSASRTRR
jgi:hypothetical protein